jgi:hypothetical protein
VRLPRHTHRHQPMQGYFPLDRETVEGADTVLHVSAGTDMQALSLR